MALDLSGNIACFIALIILLWLQMWYDVLFDMKVLPAFFNDCLFVILVNMHITFDHKIFYEVIPLF